MITIERTGNESLVDSNADIRIVNAAIVLGLDGGVTADQDQQG